MMNCGEVVIAEMGNKQAVTVDKKLSDLTVSDVVMLVNIVCKLQHTNNHNHVKPLLYELEALLGIKGSVLGVYNSKDSSEQFAEGTIEKSMLPDYKFSKCHCGLGDGLAPHSINGDYVFFYNDEGDGIFSFLCLKFDMKKLQSRQLDVLNFILPYLFSVAHGLYLQSKRLSDYSLTSREQEVMLWIIEGKDNWSMSKILGIAERTIKFHNCNIYKKLGVNTKAELICLYYRLISPASDFTIDNKLNA